LPPPLLVLSLAFILGLLLGPRLELAWTWIAGAGFACLLAGIFNRRLARFLPFLAVFRRISPVSLGLLFAALLFGAVRGLAAVPRFTEADLAWYNDGGAVEIEGVVVRPPEWRESSTLLRVRAARLTTLEGEHAGVDHAVTGLLEVNAFAGADYHYGDRLLLFGKLQTPSENDSFSYKDYWHGRGCILRCGHPVRTLLSAARAARFWPPSIPCVKRRTGFSKNACFSPRRRCFRVSCWASKAISPTRWTGPSA
jgi:hypothetical protein